MHLLHSPCCVAREAVFVAFLYLSLPASGGLDNERLDRVRDSDLRAGLAHACGINPVVFCITLSDAIELGAPAAPEAGRQ